MKFRLMSKVVEGGQWTSTIKLAGWRVEVGPATAKQAYLALRVNSAYPAFPVNWASPRCRVNSACLAFRANWACPASRVNWAFPVFQANWACRMFRTSRGSVDSQALEQSHNWLRSSQARPRRRRTSHSILISSTNEGTLLSLLNRPLTAVGRR